MRHNKNDKRIIIIYFLVTMVLLLSLLREPKEISELENRSLDKFTVFNIKDYYNKVFQDNTEKAINDQIFGSGTIKKIMQKNLNISKLLIENDFICNNNYLKIGSGEGKDYYTYNCEKVLIYGLVRDKNTYQANIKKVIDSYESIVKKYDTYFYYIPTSYTFNFKNNKETVSLIDEINKNWKYDYLKYNNFQEYKNYFYHSDHHWNHKGSYQGYKDIHNLLELNDSLIVPEKEVVFPFDFYGSSSRILQLTEYKDQFIVYKFNYPEHTTYVPMYDREYGNQEDYYSGIYKTEIYTNHYGEFYGVDYDEVIIDYNDKNKDNLLIISNSFSNSINELIASHFNKTYVIDLRHYKDFNIKQYLKKNKITKILFIIDSGGYLKDDTYTLKGEK